MKSTMTRVKSNLKTLIVIDKEALNALDIINIIVRVSFIILDFINYNQIKEVISAINLITSIITNTLIINLLS